MDDRCVVAAYPGVAPAREAIDELRRRGFPPAQISAFGCTARQSANLAGHPASGDDRPAGVPQRSAVGRLSELLEGRLHLCLRSFGVLFVGGRLASDVASDAANEGRPAVLLGMLQPLTERGIPSLDASRLTHSVEEGATLVIAETDSSSDGGLEELAASTLRARRPTSLDRYGAARLESAPS